MHHSSQLSLLQLTHLVLFPQLLHISLLAADFPFPLCVVLFSSV